MSINPAIRFTLLMSVVLAQFFLIISFINTLASEGVELSRIRAQSNKELSEKSSYREEAAKVLNEELIVKSSTETMVRINNDEMIKVRNLAPSNQSGNSLSTGQTSLISR